MKSFQITLQDCKKSLAPWVSEMSDIQNCMIRLPTSRHWRRVYYFVGSQGQTLNEKSQFRYVKKNDGQITEVILPKEFNY